MLDEAVTFLKAPPDDAHKIEAAYLHYWIDICNRLKLLSQPLGGAKSCSSNP
jgi:hypothetical protein